METYASLAFSPLSVSLLSLSRSLSHWQVAVSAVVEETAPC